MRFADIVKDLPWPTGRVRVLVTGSRTWLTKTQPHDAMRQLEDHWAGLEPLILVHGAAGSGLDRLMRDYGAARPAVWQIEPHPADWRRHGRRAGYVRNAEMVGLGADVCLAFIDQCTQRNCRTSNTAHGSHGATQCLGLARSAGIPTYRWRRGF